jgi:hypothetical protein
VGDAPGIYMEIRKTYYTRLVYSCELRFKFNEFVNINAFTDYIDQYYHHRLKSTSGVAYA